VGGGGVGRLADWWMGNGDWLKGKCGWRETCGWGKAFRRIMKAEKWRGDFCSGQYKRVFKLVTVERGLGDWWKRLGKLVEAERGLGDWWKRLGKLVEEEWRLGDRRKRLEKLMERERELGDRWKGLES
jgi:hypothetical protein